MLLNAVVFPVEHDLDDCISCWTTSRSDAIISDVARKLTYPSYPGLQVEHPWVPETQMALKSLPRLFTQLLVSSFAKIAQLPLPSAPRAFAHAQHMYWVKHKFMAGAVGDQEEYHDVVRGSASNRGQNMAGMLTRLFGF